MPPRQNQAMSRFHRNHQPKRQPPRPSVAPPDLIRQDFRVLDARETLRTTWTNEQLILIQSVQGHAHEGHGVFQGRRYPNTTMDQVTCALRLDPLSVRAERQALIDGVKDYVERTIAGNPPPALLDEDGDPLLGMSTLRHIRVEPMDVLRGLYLGGLRDDSDVRLEVEKERGIRIGGGRGYLVDHLRMEAMGLTADELAHGEWAEEIARFEREGLIVDEARANDPDIAYEYIRHRRGPGASDDAAITAAGFVWGLGVAVGVFFADAVDTLEKYVPAYGDQDEEIALEIEQRAPDLRVGREDAKRLTYLAAVPDDAPIEVPDSSLRHLLAIDRITDLCAIEAHFLAVEGIAAPSIGLSHHRVPSEKFYAYLRDRVAHDPYR
jgi:hypothetical protein